MITLLVFATAILVGLFRAFVGATLWNWFVVQPFDLPPLNMWLAYVLMMVASLFIYHLPAKSPNLTNEEQFGRQATIAIWVLITWGIGAIFHAFGVGLV